MTIFHVILNLVPFLFLFFFFLSTHWVSNTDNLSLQLPCVCVFKCVCVAEAVGVRYLGTCGKANTVVITVKGGVVGSNKDISQDPEWAPRGWDVQA